MPRGARLQTIGGRPVYWDASSGLYRWAGSRGIAGTALDLDRAQELAKAYPLVPALVLWRAALR